MSDTKIQTEMTAPSVVQKLVVGKSSVALQRLIDEVRNEGGEINLTSYNRTYHRHNR